MVDTNNISTCCPLERFKFSSSIFYTATAIGRQKIIPRLISEHASKYNYYLWLPVTVCGRHVDVLHSAFNYFFKPFYLIL